PGPSWAFGRRLPCGNVKETEMGPEVRAVKLSAPRVLVFLLAVLLLGMSAPVWAATTAVRPAVEPAAPAPARPAKPIQRTSGSLVNDFYTLVPPCRVFDTRFPTSGGPFQGGTNAGNPRTIQVGGQCGVPATATVVVLSVAVGDFTTTGYVVLYP